MLELVFQKESWGQMHARILDQLTNCAKMFKQKDKKIDLVMQSHLQVRLPEFKAEN